METLYYCSMNLHIVKIKIQHCFFKWSSMLVLWIDQIFNLQLTILIIILWPNIIYFYKPYLEINLIKTNLWLYHGYKTTTRQCSSFFEGPKSNKLSQLNSWQLLTEFYCKNNSKFCINHFQSMHHGGGCGWVSRKGQHNTIECTSGIRDIQLMLQN